MPGGLKLSTGVLVLYADDESFTLMTPQGHMFAGWITFSAFTEDGVTNAQAQVLMRASDPLYELGMTIGGHGKEDEHWMHTLRALATYVGAPGEVTVQSVCVDRGRQWSKATNIWHNAGIRSGMLYDRGPHPPDRPAVPARRLTGCPTRSSSARARTAWRPPSSWPAPAGRSWCTSGPTTSGAAPPRPS